MVANLSRAFAICLALLFVLSAAHKGTVLAHGGAGAEPLIRATRRRQRHAQALLAAAACVEAATSLLLVGLPPVGLTFAALLLATYAVELRRLAPREECNCFGSLLQTRTRRAAIARNVGLCLAAAMCAAALAGGWLELAPVNGTVVALALAIAAAPASAELLPRLLYGSQSRL